MDKIDILKKAIQAKREGLKPMMASMFSPSFGAENRQYSFNGKHFNTPEELTEYLKAYMVINGKPNIIFSREFRWQHIVNDGSDTVRPEDNPSHEAPWQL